MSEEYNKLVAGVTPMPGRADFLSQISTLLPQDSICVEIGVYLGEFSRLILEHINPKKLYLVDPWVNSRDCPRAWRRLQLTKNLLFKELDEGQAEIKRGFSYEVVKDFPDDYFDFVYIDGCHGYECVRTDLYGFLPKLKKTGLMCGHDYAEESNLSYISSKMGVIRAVDEFCEKEGFKMIAKTAPEFAHPIGFSDWALKRK